MRISHFISDILWEAKELPDMDGIVINPWGKFFVITKDLLEGWFEKPKVVEIYDNNGNLLMRDNV